MFRSRVSRRLACLGVAARLDDLVERITVLVNRSPHIASLTVDAHDLIEVPNVSCVGALRRMRHELSGAVLSSPSADGLQETRIPQSNSISSTSRRHRLERKESQTARDHRIAWSQPQASFSTLGAPQPTSSCVKCPDDGHLIARSALMMLLARDLGCVPPVHRRARALRACG